MAEQLKLSPGAVSQALTGGPSTVRVSAETIRRVNKLARQLGYRPNQAARTLRTGRSGMAGILSLCRFDDLHNQHLFLARRNFIEMGLLPIIHEVASPSPRDCAKAIDLMLDANVEAILLVRCGLPAAQIRRLRQAGVAMVSVQGRASGYFPNYQADRTSGYALLGRHLIEQGNRTITLIHCDSKQRSLQNRATKSAIDGLRQAVKQARHQGHQVTLKIHPVHAEFDGYMLKSVPHMHGYYAVGYLGMKEIITAGQVPNAVVTTGDHGIFI